MAQGSSGATRKVARGTPRFVKTRDLFVSRIPLYSMNEKTGKEERVGWEYNGLFRPCASWEEPDMKIYDELGALVGIIEIKK